MDAARDPPDAGATFYTVADERFFIGVACLVNSLRATGNRGEIVVLDNGFSSSQRARLEPHVRLVDVAEVRGLPTLMKPFPQLLDPRGVVVMIDSDVIITRNLDPIVELAAAGQICAFADIDDQRNRQIPEWEQIFELERPLRRQNYVNAGFIALSTDRHPQMLARYWELCSKVPADAYLASGADYDQPFWGGDQDVLNALLMSEVDPGAITELPEQEGPSPGWHRQVRIEDPATLRCSLAGHFPYLLHYWGSPKPWQRQSWMRVERGAYVELMPRVLFADDVTVAADPREVPPWMRPGARPAAARSVLGAINHAAREALERLPADLRARMARGIRRLPS